MTSAPGVEIRIAFLIGYLQSLYEFELGHYYCPEFVGHVANQNILVKNCEKLDFCFTITRLCVTGTAQISTDIVVYVEICLGKRHWRKKST